MCGIVGLFLKRDEMRPKLGDMLTDMLITLTDRGPDSAGIAIYGEAGETTKVTVQSETPDADFDGLDNALSDELGAPVAMRIVENHAVLRVPAEQDAAAIAFLEARGLRIMSAGASIEIFKDVGLPRDVAARFGIREMGGSHGRIRLDGGVYAY